jgi:hypothetical protein
MGVDPIPLLGTIAAGSVGALRESNADRERAEGFHALVGRKPARLRSPEASADDEDVIEVTSVEVVDGAGSPSEQSGQGRRGWLGYFRGEPDPPSAEESPEVEPGPRLDVII